MTLWFAKKKLEAIEEEMRVLLGDPFAVDKEEEVV